MSAGDHFGQRRSLTACGAPEGRLMICVEVTARTIAGQRVKHLEGCDHHGDELLAQAARIFDVHLDEAAMRGELPARGRP